MSDETIGIADNNKSILDEKQREAEAAQAQAELTAQPEPEQIIGLTLAKSEWHGDHGDEHHWFAVPAGRTAADYQADLDAFLEQRGITADDITVTTEA